METMDSTLPSITLRHIPWQKHKNNVMIVDLYLPHRCMWTSCIPMSFWLVVNMTLTLIGMHDPKMNSSGPLWYHLALWYLHPQWPCSGHATLHGSRMGVFVEHILNIGEPKERGALPLAIIWSIRIACCLTWCKHVVVIRAKTLSITCSTNPCLYSMPTTFIH